MTHVVLFLVFFVPLALTAVYFAFTAHGESVRKPLAKRKPTHNKSIAVVSKGDISGSGYSRPVEALSVLHSAVPYETVRARVCFVLFSSDRVVILVTDDGKTSVQKNLHFTAALATIVSPPACPDP